MQYKQAWLRYLYNSNRLQKLSCKMNTMIKRGVTQNDIKIYAREIHRIGGIIIKCEEKELACDFSPDKVQLQ